MPVPLGARRVIELNLPDLKGAFAVVPPDEFKSETLLDIAPAMLLVPVQSMGILRGPYVMAIIGSQQSFKRNCAPGIGYLLSWLHFRQPNSIVLFANLTGNELRCSHATSVAAAFLQLTGPKKWGF